jgi:hypothetical protein
MPSAVQATAFFLVFLLAAGCAASHHHLRLGQVSPALERYEGTDYDVLASEEVRYRTIGEPDYDAFFREAAALYGSALFAVRFVQRIERIVAGQETATPSDLAMVWILATQTLPHTQRRALYLAKEGERLRAKARRDFAWKFYKLPRAWRAAREAQANLEATQELAPALALKLHEIQKLLLINQLKERSF